MCRAMGVGVVEAGGEAEAQCAWLVKEGYADATATEDMDALTFGSGFLLRGVGTSKSSKEGIIQIELEKVLEGFELSQDEFIDLCILCGCDYTGSIGGMGPKTAYNFIKEHSTIEKVLEII